MSVIRKFPFIHSVIEDLTETQKENLLKVVNGDGTLTEASFANMPAAGSITPVLFQFDANNSKTGILILSSHYRVLIAYHRFQDLLMFKFNSNNTYEKINEYLDINELRRLLEEVHDHIVASEIDSGSATADQVLAADGDGGAEWKDVMDVITPETVESGDAVQLFGFNADGQLVKDDIPEGITVDQTIIEDSENAVAGGAVYDELADIKEDITDINSELETKANVDGNYPTMTVGVADQLSPYDDESGDDQDEPFSFQATGTGNGTQPDFATGAIALMKEKQGNTVVVNQQLNNTTQIVGNSPHQWYSFFESDQTYSFNDGEIAITTSGENVAFEIGQFIGKELINHKFFVAVKVKASDTELTIAFTCNRGIARVSSNPHTVGTSYTYICDILQPENTTELQTSWIGFYGPKNGNTTLTIQATSFVAVDLTQMFNGDIPSDLLAHPENFFRYYQGDLSYNEGELVNANGRYLKAIGRNQWDEEWESGVYDYTTGVKYPNASYIRNKTPIRVIPNTQYHFEGNGTDIVLLCYDKDNNYIGLLPNTGITPENCCYLCFYIDNATYNHDITISIYYEGESGYDQYYPYEVLTNNDTGTETLLAFDYKEPSGLIHHNTIEVDLSTITFALDNAGYWYGNKVGAKQGSKVKSTKYLTSNISVSYPSCPNGTIEIGSDTIFIKDSSIAQASDITGIIQIETKNPTTEQGTPFSENVAIDDFGSMSFEGTSGVPQGNLIFYPVDYKAFIDTLYNYADGTPSNIALKSDIKDIYCHNIALEKDDSGTKVRVLISLLETSNEQYNTFEKLFARLVRDANSKYPASGFYATDVCSFIVRPEYSGLILATSGNDRYYNSLNDLAGDYSTISDTVYKVN